LTDSSHIAPDLPEFRLLAQVAGIKPSALAAALNNPEHFSKHISAEELSRFLASMTRAMELIGRISTILKVEADRTLATKGRRS
jgi:hypothetical protein